MNDRSRFDEAGAPLPYGRQTLRAFVEDGSLGRTLMRMCQLAQGVLRLSFVLERAPAALRVHLIVEGEALELKFDREELEADALDSISAMLRHVNGVLGQLEVNHRFVIWSGAGVGRIRFGLRVLLVDVATALLAAAQCHEAESCLEANASAGPRAEPADPSTTLLRLPTVDSIVPADRTFEEDPSVAVLLAAWVQRLATFIGVERFTCIPRPTLVPSGEGPEHLDLQLEYIGEHGGSLEQSVSVRWYPRLDVQPILDQLVGLLALDRQGDDRQLVRCTAIPWGERVVFASRDEVDRLRDAGLLIEPAVPDALLDRLCDAGLELPALFGPLSSWIATDARGSELDACLRGVAALVADRVLFAHELVRTEQETCLRITIADRTTEISFPPHSLETSALEGICGIVRACNDLLVSSGMPERLLVMSGPPVWYGHRLFFLGPEWIDRLLGGPGVRLDVLPAELQAQVGVPPPRRHPDTLPSSPLPRVPTIEEVVGKRRVLESDFKCSAREEDYPLLVEEIARFARVRVTCPELARPDERRKTYDVAVVHAGEHAVVRLENHKYADVRPILAYLNAILAEQKKPRRLMVFRAGEYSSGVILATPEEIETAYALGYVREKSPAAAMPVTRLEPASASAPASNTAPSREIDWGDHAALMAALAAVDEGSLPLYVVANAYDPTELTHEESLLRLGSVHLALLARSPRIRTLLANLATACVQRGEFARALEIYDVVLASGRLDPLCAANPLYAVQNDNSHLGVMTDRAREYLEHCLPHAPENPAVYVNAAGVLLELADPDAAIDMLARAIDSGFEGIEAHLADPLFDSLRGRPAFRSLATLEPSYPVVLRRFQTLWVQRVVSNHVRKVDITQISGRLEPPPDDRGVENAASLRVFARTDDTGEIAFWQRSPDLPLERQPVVVLSASEAPFVYAADFVGFLVLFACDHTTSDAAHAANDGEDELMNPDVALLEVLEAVDPEVMLRNPRRELHEAIALTTAFRSAVGLVSG